MLQQVETSVDDPIITDNTVMTRAEKRFSAQAYCVLVLSCRGGPTSSQRFRVRGMEATTQRVRATSSCQEMCQPLLSPTKSDESVQMVRHQGKGLKVCEEQPGDKVSLQPGRPMAWDLPSQEEPLSASEQAGCARRLEARIPQTWHRLVKKRTTGQ